MKGFFLLLMCLPLVGLADEINVRGKTFPIVEPDLILVMKSRMIALEKSGYFRQLGQALENQAGHYAARPTPVAGLTKTITNKVWFYDPTIIMSQNIISPSGEWLVKAGTRYNPLEKMNLGETLIFYNADDPDQRRWINKKNNEIKGEVKNILVNGSVFDEEKRLNQRVYFDQWGRLISRFHIQHVPALVHQMGARLEIEEVVP